MLASDPPAWDTALQIKQVEQECDSLTHEIIQRLNRTFVTPIDREDIHALATSLDDVMDAIDAAATVVRRYRIVASATARVSWPRSIWQSAMQVGSRSRRSSKRKGVDERAVEINRLENAADDVHDEALRRLFEEEKNAIAVIKWKEMFDLLEQATDRCEDVANVLERRRRQARVSAGVDFAFVVLVIVVALVFDYINGFHDAANSIATVVSTRVLTPGKAVHLGRVLQLRRRVHLRHRRRQDGRHGHDRHQRRHLRGDLRRPGGRDHLGPDHLVLRSADQFVARADRRLRRRGGGQGGLRRHHPRRLDQDADLHRAGAADRLGARLHAHGGDLLDLPAASPPSRVDHWFRRLQLVSAALYSLGHGANDAQKTMGIIAGALFAGGLINEFTSRSG